MKRKKIWIRWIAWILLLVLCMNSAGTTALAVSANEESILNINGSLEEEMLSEEFISEEESTSSAEETPKEVCIFADLVPAFQHQAGFSIKVIIFALVFEPATVTFSSFGIKIISFVTDTQPAFCKFTFVVVVIILTIILYPGIFVFRHAGNQDVRTV